MKKENIISLTKKLKKRIEDKENQLIDLLLSYESHVTAKDEIERSKDSLENIHKEMEYLTSTRIRTMCTFFPVNLPLYSLVIFALIPSFIADDIFVRPPELMSKILKELIKILDLDTLFPNVHIVELERSLFRDAYVSVADVVLFTGRYENAISIQRACPDALFIYNGAGVNPVVVTDTADIDLAVKKVIEMRIFNSGQDCAGSDAILVHKNLKKKFIEELVENVKKVKVGNYRDCDNQVGTIVKQDNLLELDRFFLKHKEHMIYGGEIDFKQGIVFPTIFVEDLQVVTSSHFTEFFSPVFYILIYEKDDDLKKYFLHESYRSQAMYVSVFGNSKVVDSLDCSTILHNKIVNDVERGNHPYGGFGDKANFIIWKGKKITRPLLISKEIAESRK